MADIPTALQIIRDNDITSPREFAEKMWPNSEGWQHMHKIGRGASSGAAMAFAGGGFLGKLRAQGLIQGGCNREGITLTDKGKERLQRGAVQAITQAESERRV
jgi:hypothetical protein